MSKRGWAGFCTLDLFSLELPRAVKFSTVLVLNWHFFGKKKRMKKEEENLVKIWGATVPVNRIQS